MSLISKSGGTMMRHAWIALLLCLISFSFVACANEMPDEWEDQGDDTVVEDGEEWSEDIIDTDLYTFSTIYDKRNHYIRNLPGMLLVPDQKDGATLYYINKATGVGRIYCFDPLCDHHSCAAAQIMLSEKCIYHPADGNLYYSAGKASRLGSTLDCLDVNTQESRTVWKGNGNMLKSGSFFVMDQYLFFCVARTEGGYDVMRYDVLREQVEQMQPPAGKVFRAITISGEYIFVYFMDEAVTYRTTAAFSTYTLLDIPVGIWYVDENLFVDRIKGEEIRGLAFGNIIGFETYDILTGEYNEFCISEMPLYPKGFDGTYIYYTEYEKRGENYVEASMLYRVSILDGEVEEVCDFDGMIQEIAKFENTVYYYRKEYRNDVPVFIYGKLTESEEGFVAEDFEFVYP